MCLSVLFLCIYTECHMHALYPWVSKDRVSSSRAAVTDGCELPSWFWELNLGPLQKQ